MFVTILALTAWRLPSSSSWGAAVWTFAVRDMLFSDPYTMLCCWCVGSLHVFHPPWLASSFVVQKHNIGVVGREAEKMLLMTKYRSGWRFASMAKKDRLSTTWQEWVVLFDIVFNRALDQFLHGDVYSGELPVFARYGRDQRSMWSVFNKKCSRGERENISTQRMHIYEFA